MTGGGVLVTNGEYDGGGDIIFFFKKPPPTNIRRNFLIYKLFVNYFSRNFVVYNNDGGCKGVGAFVVTGE